MDSRASAGSNTFAGEASLLLDLNTIVGPSEELLFLTVKQRALKLAREVPTVEK